MILFFIFHTISNTFISVKTRMTLGRDAPLSMARAARAVPQAMVSSGLDRLVLDTRESRKA